MNTFSNGISAVDLTPSTDKVMNLFGSEPQFILQVSSQAIEFWCFQKELELTQARKATDDLQTQLQQMEKSYKEKLFEQQRNVEFLHRQIDQLRTEHDKQQKELTELKEKYAQKSRYHISLLLRYSVRKTLASSLHLKGRNVN
jgi:septal ring factor EnvC (AmiA/AmiB activator)